MPGHNGWDGNGFSSAWINLEGLTDYIATSAPHTAFTLKLCKHKT